MQPLKLCFVGWADHVHLERWAGYFARAGHDVSVLSMHGAGRYPPGVAQYVLRHAKRNRVLADAELRLLLWRLRPDLVHVHWAHFAVAIARVWDGPLAVTAWGSDIYRREAFTPGQWRAMCAALARASLVTCDSDDLAGALIERCGVAESVVKVVQWGVDTDLFSPGQSALARELGIEGRPVVLSPRNFAPHYNLDTVVEAFARARQKVPSAFLLMKRYASEADYSKAVVERIDSLGLAQDCRIVDAVDYERMPDLYRAARVTISVPHSDATPVSILEAMACGSVPVVSDLPSLREWIVDGDNGYVASATDTDAIARSLVSALTLPDFQERAAARNRALVMARASQAAHMQRCQQLYRDAIQSGAGARAAVPA
jgi:glycosyltransferase involved in cell wall biosynthesis